MLGDLFDSPWKILIIAVVLIVLFGGKKMPDAARSLGRSMRILKAEVQDLHHDHDHDHDTETAEMAQPTPVITAPQQHQQQIDQLQQQVRDLQQQQAAAASQAVTVNGSAATETPQTQQPG
jgi:sec-independent protein translocase protein TatA